MNTNANPAGDSGSPPDSKCEKNCNPCQVNVTVNPPIEVTPPAYRHHEKRSNKYELANLFVLGMTLLSAIAAAVFTGFLWQSTAQLVTDTNDTSKLQLQPYVLFDSGSVKFIDETTYYATVIVKNTGQTPAYSVRQVSDSRVDDFSSDIDIVLSRFPQKIPGTDASTDLGNNIPFRIGVKGYLKPGDLASIRKLEKGIYMWGRIKYYDQFNHRCWIEQFWVRADPTYPVGQDWPFIIIRNDWSGCKDFGIAG